MEIFFVTLKQMAILLTFIAIGYVMNKAKLVNANVGAVFATAVTFFFMPMTCFNTMIKNTNLENIIVKWPVLLVSVIFLISSFFLAKFISNFFTKDKMEHAVYTYSFVITNLGYMGYPIVEAVFGEIGLYYFMLFCLPLNIFLNTIGMNMLTQRTKINFKMLLNPIIIALVLGVVLGLLGVKLPDFIFDITNTGAACTTPCAMILLGFVLAKTPFIKIVLNPKMYIAAVIRLIALPLIFGGITFALCYFLKLDMLYVFLVVAVSCLPMGSNTIVFPESIGKDGTLGAQSCFVSTIMALITLPVMFMLLTEILKGYNLFGI